MDLYNNHKFIPMLLEEEKMPFDDSDFIFELKFDGTRTLIYTDGKSILIKNRRGNRLNEIYPELLNIKKIAKKKVIFDGEIIVMDNGIPVFEKLQQRALLKNKLKIAYYMKTMPVIFIAYDLLYDGKDITKLPLMERKKRLNKFPNSNIFIKSEYIDGKGKLFYKETKKLGLEGIVAKKKNSIYKINKRTKDWLKIKNIKLESFFVAGYKINEKSASILLIDKLTNDYVGKVSISIANPEFNLIKKTPINKNRFIKDDFIHIELKYSCKVEYMNRTKNGSLRQPVYRGLE